MKLTLFAYCGMSIPLAEGDREDVRQAAARWLRARRREGLSIAVTWTRGWRWEVLEPEDACFVPDQCGVLRILLDPAHLRTCGWCEQEFTTNNRTEGYCSLACQDHAGDWRCGDAECEICGEDEVAA